MNRIPDPQKMKRVKGPSLKAKDKKNIKVRITTYLDQDILEALRQAALESGGKYQAILNQILREGLLGKTTGILARVSRLEKKVFRRNQTKIKRRVA